MLSLFSYSCRQFRPQLECLTLSSKSAEIAYAFVGEGGEKKIVSPAVVYPPLRFWSHQAVESFLTLAKRTATRKRELKFRGAGRLHPTTKGVIVCFCLSVLVVIFGSFVSVAAVNFVPFVSIFLSRSFFAQSAQSSDRRRSPFLALSSCHKRPSLLLEGAD